ncbi:MAG: uracil phosphoribosyltransferase [Ilumatobacteraceae bacterium]
MSNTGVDVRVVDHPLVQDALARIRDKHLPNALFRTNLERIGLLLLAEATSDLPTAAGTVETPIPTAAVRRLAVQPVVVPVLRAGLGFVAAAQELLPDADIGFVGVSRNEETFQPEAYVNRLPDSLAGRPVIVIDPMLATGGSLAHTIQLLLDRGAPAPITVVCALAAPEGIERLRTDGHHLRIVTAAIDERLDDRAFIVPGLGDAGDRQFGAGV